MNLRFWFASLGMLAMLLGTSSQVAGHGPENAPVPPRADRPEATYRGGVVTPPLPKPKFTLTDTSGAPYDLWSRTQGYVTLLFFGYTYCPDECPLQMSNIAIALEKGSVGVQSVRGTASDTLGSGIGSVPFGLFLLAGGVAGFWTNPIAAVVYLPSGAGMLVAGVLALIG